MLIRKFDFLSSPPQMYFLHKKTSKKLFGGILFIIYFLIMIIVIIFYFLDFYLNDRYDIKYSLYKNFTSNGKKNNDTNSYLNFSISLKKYSDDLSEVELDKDILILDEDSTILTQNTVYSRNPTNFSFVLVHYSLFDCNFTSNINDGLFYILNISYSGYKIDHQNKNIPLERNSNEYPFYKVLYFSLSKTTVFNINWGYIKYKEERGLLGLFDNFSKDKKEYFSIDIDSINQINSEKTLEIDDGLLCTKYIAMIFMKSDNNQYIQYIRLKKSILDIFANIGALFSSIFTIFSYIFDFYSKNYDNYKLIKSILSEPKIISIYSNIKIQRMKTIKFENINRNNKNIIKNDNQSFNTSKSVPFKSKEFNKQKNDNAQNKFNFKYNSDIIKINFIQFLLNHIYLKKIHRRKEQKIIDICNNILSKYISIDIILYNQIIFENFLKDYKWNDNNLKSIWNNNLIKQLNSNT